MKNAPLTYLTKFLASKAIILYLLLLIICFFIFNNNSLPVLWIIFGLIEVIAFFHFSTVLSKQWAHISEKSFKSKIFQTSLIIRFIYVIIIYYFYNYMTGTPYEFGAADSLFYNIIGNDISNLIRNSPFNIFNIPWYQITYSDRGFPFYLGIVYTLLFQSILITRLLNVVIDAWMCLLIYRLTQRNFGEAAARIASILVMLSPNLIYYTGLHLKETLMVFLVVAFIERADLILHDKRRYFRQLVLVILLGLSLFFFRTVLAVSVWFAFYSALIFSKHRFIGWSKRLSIGIWVFAAVFIFLSGKIILEVEKYVKDSSSNQEEQMKNYASGKGRNVFAEYGSTVVFFPITLIGPLPTLVNTNQDNAMMINGAMFTRNIYSFFVIIALISFLKQKVYQKYIIIISFIFSYLAILASSGFALSERFHIVVIPFLLVLSGYGITQMNKKYLKGYLPYLVFLAVIIIGWNWFKLAGRGMI